MTSYASLSLPELSNLESYYIVSQKYEHEEDRST